MKQKNYRKDISSVNTPVMFHLSDGSTQFFPNSQKAQAWFDQNYADGHSLTNYVPTQGDSEHPIELNEVTVTANAPNKPKNTQIRRGIDMYIGANYSPRFNAAYAKLGMNPLNWPKYIPKSYWDSDTHKAINEGSNIAAGVIAAPFLAYSAAQTLPWLAKTAPYLSARGWLGATQAAGNTPAWLTPTSAATVDATLAGSTTGMSVNDMIQNGPNVGNVLGTTLGVGGLAYEAAPTVMKGYTAARNALRPTIVGMQMRKMPLNKIQSTELPLNVGWGPRQTLSVTHKSDQASPLLLYNERRWDVLNEGANPLGIWFQGKLGIPRTTNTGATPIKAEKALKARQLFTKRPYTHSGDLTLDKPLVTIGDVPSRSVLSYQAEQMGADGLIYNNVYDNGYDANQVILSFKQPDASKKQFFKFPSFDNLYQIMEQQKQLQKIERQNSVNQGIDDVLNYIGSKKHVNQIMKSGVPEKDATRIATDMHYNVLATDVQLDYPILSNALGEFDSGFGPAFSNVLRPNYTFKPVTRTYPLLDKETIRRNIHHELGGHGATVGYNPNYYEDGKLQSIYETAMQNWSPSYKQIYDHNKKLVPERLPQYKHSTDPHIKYLEGVDEYSARARSELIQENNEGFNELYKYFTKESVDKLKNNIWLLLPAMLGTGTVITNNR